MLKHIRYFSYVARHKWFVFIACCRFGIPIAGIVHDWSKFLPSEWLPYARFFYGKYPSFEEVKIQMPAWTSLTKEAVKASFDCAWNHHQKRNPHHWQYWLLTFDHGGTTVLPMPDRYRREMLADWIGAGRAITGRYEVESWYAKNKDKMHLHPDTRAWIEERMRVRLVA